MNVEFSQLAALVRDDMLGFENKIPARKIAKRFGVEVEEIEMALDALKYLILHVVKTNSITEKDFTAVFSQSGLQEELQDPLYNCIKSHVAELREILDTENKIGKLRL